MDSMTKMFAFIFIGLMLFTLNPAMAEGSKGWNDSQILSVSDELAKAALKLRVECRRSPPKYFEQTTGRHIEFRYHVRHFLSVSVELSNALEDGRGKASTYPMYATLASMRNDLNRYSEAQDGAWLPVEHAVAEVNKHLSELTKYYSDD